jgi:hypothetical protein|tara:strand:+ start:285 stop:509 length:225 start_codon:yes stop_codon:yes gene_type:complete
MRYQSIVHIDNQKLSLLQFGILKLQVGQWVKLAWCSHPSRWVGVTNTGTVWVSHYPQKKDSFETMCRNYKSRKA